MIALASAATLQKFWVNSTSVSKHIACVTGRALKVTFLHRKAATQVGSVAKSAAPTGAYFTKVAKKEQRHERDR